MARNKTARTPYQWANGTFHTRPQTTGPKPPKPAAPKPPGSNPFGPGGAMYGPAEQTLIGIANKTIPVENGKVQYDKIPSQPLPDPAYEQSKITAERNRGLADANAAYQTGQIENTYGFTDLSNPYSRAALLKESYHRQQLGTTNNYAAQGQLYSGAYGRMQGENTRNYSISDDALRREYAGQLHGVQQGRLQAYADYGTNLTAADWERLMKQFGGGR